MKGKYILAGLALAILTIALAGCDIFGAGVSASERMDEFASDMNDGHWSSLWEHTDGSMTNQVKDSSWWQTYFTTPFDYDMSGDSATSSNNGSTYKFTLEATETEGMFGTAKIYKITKITQDGTTIFH